MIRHILISIFVLFTLSFVAFAQSNNDNVRDSFGDDEFIAGFSVVITKPVVEDLFAAGQSVIISAPIGDDAHVAANSVSINADVGGDVYAMGNSVTITSSIGDDLTAAGASVNISGTGINGDARLAGANVIINAPIKGYLNIFAKNAEINSVIEGDFNFNGETISFSKNAKINGLVIISATSDVKVPLNVAPASRVTIERVEKSDYSGDMRDIARDSIKGFFPDWLGKLTILAVLFVVGIIWLALFKQRSAIAYRVSMGSPIKSAFFGTLALSAFIGLIPVVAMTIIGIPLVPVALVLLVLACLIGFIAGAYFIGAKLISSFGLDVEPTATGIMKSKTIALIAGLVSAFLLGLIPFIGWLITIFIVCFGLGGITHAALIRWIDSDFHQTIKDESLTS